MLEYLDYVWTSLRDWFAPGRTPQLGCCKKSSWVLEQDLGSAEGFEYLLGKCAKCGTEWMSVFCVATSITGYEPIAAKDVEAMRRIEDGAAMKEFLRRWGDANL